MINTEVGGYRLLRQIGAGGMGAVYEAQDGAGHRVALKMLHPQVADNPDSVRRLQREAHVINHVKSRGVAHVLDLETDGPHPFVVTELIEGPTLAQDVTKNGPWNREDLADLADWLVRILTELHASGVVHRDIKPSNIMLSAQGPVLIDFGIAQMATDERMTVTGQVTGTPGYLPPEVIRGQAPAPASDWWAWAAVLVFCATGRQPFGSGPLDVVLARVSTGNVDVEGLEDQIAIPLQAALRVTPSTRAVPEAVVAALSAPPEEFSPDAFALTTVMPNQPSPHVTPGEQAVEQAVEQAADGTGNYGFFAPATQVTPTPPGPGPAMVSPSETIPYDMPDVASGHGTAMRGGEAGDVAYRDPNAATFDTQDVTVTPPRGAYQVKPVRLTPIAGILHALVLGGITCVTGPRIMVLFPVILVIFSIIGLMRNRVITMRTNRGEAHGGDIAKSALHIPRFLLHGVLLSLGASLLGALTWGILYMVCSNTISTQRAGATWPPLSVAATSAVTLTPMQSAIMWTICAISITVAWWLPAGKPYREGSRATYMTCLPHPALRLLWKVLLVLVIIALVTLTHTDIVVYNVMRWAANVIFGVQ